MHVNDGQRCDRSHATLGKLKWFILFITGGQLAPPSEGVERGPLRGIP